MAGGVVAVEVVVVVAEIVAGAAVGGYVPSVPVLTVPVLTRIAPYSVRIFFCAPVVLVVLNCLSSLFGQEEVPTFGPVRGIVQLNLPRRIRQRVSLG